MRSIIVPELRQRWPNGRIIHELPTRYSTNRIDIAAVTPTEIISVEIKSSRDVCDRLDAQLRAFTPISSRTIVALAPIWNRRLPDTRMNRRHGITTYQRQLTEAQEIIARSDGPIETWTVDAEAGTIDVTQQCYSSNKPWLSRMLHMLHVSELVEIATAHRCWQGKRPVHETLVSACADMMAGHEIVKSVCAALRQRQAFGADSDPPIHLEPDLQR